MLNGDPRDGFFYPTLTIDSYILYIYAVEVQMHFTNTFRNELIAC